MRVYVAQMGGVLFSVCVMMKREMLDWFRKREGLTLVKVSWV
jgi:hypothetical protein